LVVCAVGVKLNKRDATTGNILDAGGHHGNGPYHNEVPLMWGRLSKPITTPAKSASAATFPAYGTLPSFGGAPWLQSISGLDGGCVVVGAVGGGDFKAKWFGKNPSTPMEMWSSTKVAIVPHLLNLGTKGGRSNLDTSKWMLNVGSRSWSFDSVLLAIDTYSGSPASSNSLALTLKRLLSAAAVNQYVRAYTGDSRLSLAGGYGESAASASPKLMVGNTALISSPGSFAATANNMSPYAMARLFAMIGYHMNLPNAKKFPGVQWASTKGFIGALGMDDARYIDYAFKRLNMAPTNVVIISKLGAGNTAIRHRNEFIYSAFTRFTWKGVERSAAMSFRTFGQTEAQCDAFLMQAVLSTIQNLVSGQLSP